jgi:hypothetical protein
LLSEFPTLCNVNVTVKTDKKITEAFSAVSGEKIAFSQNDNEISLSLNPMRLHELVIMR